jgi:hypothetical protein
MLDWIQILVPSLDRIQSRPRHRQGTPWEINWELLCFWFGSKKLK